MGGKWKKWAVISILFALVLAGGLVLGSRTMAENQPGKIHVWIWIAAGSRVDVQQGYIDEMPKLDGSNQGYLVFHTLKGKRWLINYQYIIRVEEF
ncbi:MAG: hypothetical protein ACM3TT_11965 [Syntrophothermus sp.]